MHSTLTFTVHHVYIKTCTKGLSEITQKVNRHFRQLFRPHERRELDISIANKRCPLY